MKNPIMWAVLAALVALYIRNTQPDRDRLIAAKAAKDIPPDFYI